MSKILCYSDLISLSTFDERFNYLKLTGVVGQETFGFDRYVNQAFYNSKEWKRARDAVILRDNGCDLGIPDLQLFGIVLVHHMNPITVDDIEKGNPDIFNPEFLICVSKDTHNAIHYGDDSICKRHRYVERTPYDTCPWRR